MAAEVKVVVTGDPCAGKSQVITQFVNNTYVTGYDPTIEDSYRKQVKVGSTDVLLDILDTAGHEEYSAMRDQYCRTADVLIIMYSVTNKQSFDNVRKYHDHICRVKDSPAVPFILVGTNIDKRLRLMLPKKFTPIEGRDGLVDPVNCVDFNNGLKMAATIKAQSFFECSAKTREGVDDVFNRAAEVGLQYKQNKAQGKTSDDDVAGLHSLLLQVTDSSFSLFNEILRQGTEENYDIRVMLVGRAAVGKTTLTRRLLRLPVNLKSYDSTNGVDVHIHSCDIHLDSGEWEIKEQETSIKKKLMKIWARRIKRHEETAKKTKITSYRDFHLRCAKLLQKIQASDFSGLMQDNKQTLTEERSDEEDETMVKQLDTSSQTYCLRDSNVLSKPAKSGGPIHKSVDNSDVEQTLEKARALPNEKVARFAKVSLYDFAGQYIFHASHPTFLSPQAIYILVFDLTKLIEWKGKKSKVKKQLHDDEEQYFGDCRGHSALGDRESIFFWLNVIYLFAALKKNIKPQVILVGTHKDKLSKPEHDALIQKFMRELRCELATTPLKELVSDDFVVDNSRKDDKSFSEIKAEIFRLAKLQPDWGKKTPSKWLPLERELQCLKESGLKVLSLEELNDINDGLDLRVANDIEMEMFLKFLHDTGEIIFFSDLELRDHIVLDPVWLIDALKLVITSDRFAVRIPKLAEKWIDFYKTGVIYRSTIVGIFEERTQDPALYENHEHVLRLMEKFLFIAAPVQFPGEITGTNSADEEVDTCYIMPCMIHKEIDTQMITNIEGTCRSSVLCLVALNHFLPPAIFQKFLAMCIKKWPIVEQHGQKLIFCGVCKFNLDSSKNYKLTVFQVGYAIHGRITSYSEEDNVPHRVCGAVLQCLVDCLRSVLRGMGFSDKFRTCFQCPGFSPLKNGGYVDLDLAQSQDNVTCDDCAISHSVRTDEILKCWIRKSADGNFHDDPKELEHMSACSQENFVGGTPLDPLLYDVGDVNGAAGLVSMDPMELDNGGVNDVDSASLASIQSGSHDADTSEDEDDPVDIAIGPITQEHINQARLCNVIVTVCADVLRDILLNQVPGGYNNFYGALLGARGAIANMRQIRQEQFQLMFPDPNAHYTGTVDQFDITLLYTLIRNISSCPAPATGWGRAPIDQPRDVSLSANVERIRLIRNEVSGHSKDGKLGDQALQDYFVEISQILDDVEAILGDKGFKAALEERRKQIITPHEAKVLRRQFEIYRQQLKEDMRSVLETYESFKEAMDVKVEQLSTAIAQNL